MDDLNSSLKLVALAGGVGGAKLVDGLARIVPPSQLRVVVNTGDDFEHWGLTICPDLDTVMYTLAGIANPEAGWGLAGETFRCLDAMGRLGEADWFRVGDRDLATHLFRTRRLREGWRLTEVTAALAAALGVQPSVLPMSDDPMRTLVLTDEGELPFQEYFVHRACQPEVHGFRWAGQEQALPTVEVLTALRWADLVILCPSNPFVSIGPILALPGVRAAIAARPAVAVSPILGGNALKGPAAKMYRELGIRPSATAVAAQYIDLIRGFVLDTLDVALVDEIRHLSIRPCAMPTVMRSPEDRVEVARGVLAFGRTLL